MPASGATILSMQVGEGSQCPMAALCVRCGDFNFAEEGQDRLTLTGERGNAAENLGFWLGLVGPQAVACRRQPIELLACATEFKTSNGW